LLACNKSQLTDFAGKLHSWWLQGMSPSSRFRPIRPISPAGSCPLRAESGPGLGVR